MVIPSFERPDDLRRCLTSLSKDIQASCPDYEIIVTDDSKSNGCRLVVENEFPCVSWGKGKQNGPAGNRNAGVDRANGQWIVFLDDDCIANENYLLAYYNAITENAGIEVFEGRIFADRPRKTWAEGCPENEKGGMLWTSNLCLKKETFTMMGGLDEEFKIAYEDVDLSYRLRKAGIKTFFCKEAAVCHPWRTLRAGGKNWKNKNYEFESLLIFLRKNPESIQEYGNYRIYLKNFLRMISKDFSYCLFKLHGRGLDILFSQAFSSIKIAIYLKSNFRKLVE